MANVITKLRDFLLYTVGADRTILAKAPEGDRVRLEIRGGLVCTTAMLGGLVAAYEVALLLTPFIDKLAIRAAVACFLGAAWAVEFWLVERLLLVSLPAVASNWRMAWALSWRGVLALCNAGLMASSLALLWFHPEIIGALDEHRLEMMDMRRKTVDGIFGISAISVDVEQLERAITANAQKKRELPPDVVDLALHSETCDRELQTTERNYRTQITSARADIAQLERRLADATADIASDFQARINMLQGKVRALNGAINAKQQICRSFRVQIDDRLGQKLMESIRRVPFGDVGLIVADHALDMVLEEVCDPSALLYLLKKMGLLREPSGTGDAAANTKISYGYGRGYDEFVVSVRFGAELKNENRIRLHRVGFLGWRIVAIELAGPGFVGLLPFYWPQP